MVQATHAHLPIVRLHTGNSDRVHYQALGLQIGQQGMQEGRGVA